MAKIIHSFFLLAPLALVAIRWYTLAVLGAVEPAGYMYNVSMVVFILVYYFFREQPSTAPASNI